MNMRLIINQAIIDAMKLQHEHEAERLGEIEVIDGVQTILDEAIKEITQ